MKLKLFFLSFFCCFYLFSQTKGVVSDVNGLPIENVRVYIADQDIVSYTNAYGQFNFSSSIPVNTTFEFKKIGYSTKLYKHTGVQINMLLEKLHVELDEVGIVEESKKLGNSQALSIESKSIDDNFILSNSLVQSIITLPGVNTIGSGLGIHKIVIRGLSGMRVVSYLNGMKIENQQWANDHSLGFTDLGLSSI